MTDRKNYYDLPFDQFSRQMKVHEIIDSLRDKNQSFKILDVGGYKGVTAQLHSNDDVTILDVFDIKEENYVKGSGLELPFGDKSFDFVVSFDVFEHIKNQDREKFLQESSRVAKRGVITAAPVSSAQNEEAEKSLNDLYKKIHGTDHPWLKEHIEYGLPELNQARDIFSELGLNTVSISSNETFLWVLMQGAIFLNSKYPLRGTDLKKLNHDYNRMLHNDGSENLEENYRLIACGFASKQDSKQVDRFLTGKRKTFGFAEKAKLAQRINEHYRVRFEDFTNELTRKIQEKDFLQETINNVVAERDQLRKDLEAIKQTIPYKAASRISGIKKRVKK